MFLGILKKDDPRREKELSNDDWIKANTLYISQKKKYKIKNRKTPALDLSAYRKKRGYREYLRSDWWITRRAKYWETHIKKCYCCGAFADNLHHTNYSWMGMERDKDFVALCHSCHTKVHEIQNKTGKLKNNHKTLKQTI